VTTAEDPSDEPFITVRARGDYRGYDSGAYAGYEYARGTSFATGYVTATLAAMLQVAPHLSAADIRACIQHSVVNGALEFQVAVQCARDRAP
jgi:hypothetical protein